MFDIHRVELDWGGRKLVLETGKIARQADGAVVATYGETKVLATVVAAKEPRRPGVSAQQTPNTQPAVDTPKKANARPPDAPVNSPEPFDDVPVEKALAFEAAPGLSRFA